MNGTRANQTSIWSIGRLLPRLMLFFFLLDLVLRFIPLDPLTFRAWEAMLRHYPNAVGPFIPNKHYHRDNSYGGVAGIGNLPALRHYHSVDFTTDAYGFHNPPALAQSNAIGIVVGDSFAVGSELPEDQSLSAQLTERFGGYFYNAGSPQPLHLRSLEAVAQRLGLHHGLVIFEFLESRALQDPPSATPDGARGAAQTFLFRHLGQEWTDRLGTPLNELHSSPLQALSAKLVKKVQDDVLLPNSFASFVIQEKLSNGEPIVFLPAEFKSPVDPRKAAERWAGLFRLVFSAIAERRPRSHRSTGSQSHHDLLTASRPTARCLSLSCNPGRLRKRASKRRRSLRFSRTTLCSRRSNPSRTEKISLFSG